MFKKQACSINRHVQETDMFKKHTCPRNRCVQETDISSNRNVQETDMFRNKNDQETDVFKIYIQRADTTKKNPIQTRLKYNDY